MKGIERGEKRKEKKKEKKRKIETLKKMANAHEITKQQHRKQNKPKLW